MKEFFCDGEVTLLLTKGERDHLFYLLRMDFDSERICTHTPDLLHKIGKI